jgi:hypothetical protein
VSARLAATAQAAVILLRVRGQAVAAAGKAEQVRGVQRPRALGEPSVSVARLQEMAPRAAERAARVVAAL